VAADSTIAERDRPLELTGHVLVTGGASGLGAAVARAVTSRGAGVTVLDRKSSPDGFPTELVDLANGRAAEEAVLRVAKDRGGMSALVACAGIDVPGRLDEVAAEEWEQVVAVNLLGTAAVIRAALPFLEQAKGRIVTVASTLGHRAVPDATAYCASKFGIVGFTRALAAELRGEVGVTLLTPGGMQTAFFEGRDERYRPPEDMELSSPDAVAEAVVFALSAPRSCEVRELVVTPPAEMSWP
jgi:NADP-dependent 3-hydroxy acid dehydrogenase YdfG